MCACIVTCLEVVVGGFGASIDGGYCSMCSTSFVSNQSIVGGFKNNQGHFWGSSLCNFQQVLCVCPWLSFDSMFIVFMIEMKIKS